MAVDPIRRIEPRRDVAPLERIQLSPVEREQQRRQREERRRKRRDAGARGSAEEPRDGLDLRA